MPDNRKTMIKVTDTPADVAREAAKFFIARAQVKLAEDAGRCFVALSGGSTPKVMYEYLRRVEDRFHGLLRKIDYFFGDERAVPNDHPESNVGTAIAGFLGPLEVPEERIHRLNGAAEDLQQEAQRATRDLVATVPEARMTNIPEFDLVFLGMGTDGHTASLFPGTSALDVGYPEWCGYVANEVPQLNTTRLTLSFEVINTARMVVVLCTGANKAAILGEIFSQSEAEHRYPIQRLAARRVIWMLDAEAASSLSPEILEQYSSGISRTG